MGMYRWLQALDRRAFLGFEIWEFGFRSLFRPYGHLVLAQIALRYPRHTWRGLLAYRRFTARQPFEQPIIPVGVDSEADFLRGAARAGPALLVAIGFCQKPMHTPETPQPCPSGRPNHDCLYLEGLDLGEALESEWHSACRVCFIRLVGTRALQAGASVYIMTSAWDIAHDVFLPTLARRRFRQALMTICPYSVRPIALPLLICGIDTLLMPYERGVCADFTQWSLADRGIKRERTFLPAASSRFMLRMLKAIAAARTAAKRPVHRRFRREGHVYVPKEIRVNSPLSVSYSP